MSEFVVNVDISEQSLRRLFLDGTNFAEKTHCHNTNFHPEYDFHMSLNCFFPKDPIVRKNGGSFTRGSNRLSSTNNRVKSAGNINC